MYNRLFDFIETSDILCKNQFGFQRRKSTEHTVLDLYTNILQAIESKEETSCIFLDFAKAFDTVNHEILFGKLENYGIRGLPLIWFKSYLSNRKQVVKIGQCVSRIKTITCGVPQGSVLGPLLFLIYVNDIHVSSPKVKFNLFVDDTCIFHSSKQLSSSEKELNIILENVANWLKAKKLNLNVKKSNLLLFKLDRNTTKEKLNIHLDTEIFEQKEFAKYLGIYIDENLTWHNHMQMTINKISKGITILRTMRHFLQEKQLKDLYSSFIKPYTE